MKNYFSNNLEFLRKSNGLNKTEMPSLLNVGRSTYYGYESGDSFPTFSGLLEIADYFGISLTELVELDLKNSDLKLKTSNQKKPNSSDLKSDVSSDPIGELGVISIAKEPLGHYGGGLIPNVFDFETPAAAGEAMVLLAEDKYRPKPNLYLPGLGPGIHIRNPVKGDSMHSTIKDGDKVVSTLVQDAHDIRQGFIHTILDREEGLVCKRLYIDRKSHHLEFVSDNEIYKAYKRHFKDIVAVFRVREVHSWDLRPYYADLRKEIRDIHNEMADIKRFIKYK